jgi:hypothetical protein
MKFPGKLVPDMLPMNKISKVKVLSGYRLELQFDGGVSGTVGLSDKVGEGVFAPWCDPLFFEQVAIGSAVELVWGKKSICVLTPSISR